MTVLGIFVALMGLACLIMSLRGQANAKAWAEAAGRWPITTATIRTSGIVVQGTFRNPRWIPALDYTYSVNGREFTGNCLCYGYIGTNTPEAAQAMISRYPAGAVVPLHYDPARPEYSVLEPRVTTNLVWGIVAGIPLIILGVVAALVR